MLVFMNKFKNMEGQDNYPNMIMSFIYPVRETTLLFVILTFLYLCSCTRLEYNEKTKLKHNEMTKSTALETENIYIFTYNDDPLMRLDSYQYYKTLDNPHIGIDSRSGNKVCIICANSHKESYHWHEIQSYGHLKKMTFRLEDENPDFPIASSELKINAGQNKIDISAALKPFLSEIILNSIKVDFKDEAYRGSKLENIKVYLTNVNAEISLLDDYRYRQKRIINLRALDEKAVQACSYPSMLRRTLEDIEDGKVVQPKYIFNCFPNTCKQESLGSPFTRIVIEAQINGNTYWYPININRHTKSPNRNSSEEGIGVERNCKYIYNITIKKLGSDDPDKPVDFAAVESKLIIKPWKELEEYDINF